MDDVGVRRTSRRLRDLVEPIAANVYFAPEAQEAYAELGLGYLPGYFCSRSACMGQVAGEVVVATFGVFNPAIVLPSVEEGWSKTDATSVLAAREWGARASLARILGDPGDDVARATALLRRAGEAATLEGHPLAAGLVSLGWPGDPYGDLWRAADIVREHRGDSHIAAWITADLDACEIGVLTDPWRGQPLKSWVRSRAWSEEELDAACDRLRSRSLLDGDVLTDTGFQLREDIETATDQQERRMVAAMGDDADRFFTIVDGWAQSVIDQGGYPGRVQWSRAT